MSLNASIIEQRVAKLVGDHRDTLAPGDEDKLRSKAFVWLATSTVLDIPLEEARDLITDGGGDIAIDALHVGDIVDGEFVVTLVQGKYKRKPVGKFPANDVGKVAQIVGVLFDPDLPPPHARLEVKARVEEIRSLVREGNFPTVRVVLCNNGERWGADADAIIASARLPHDQVIWEYIGPDELVGLMQRPREVHDDLQLVGEAVLEEFDFCRVLVGKICVTELARLVATHGDRLLERNIRRFLGLRNNRVNQAIASTLRSPAKRSNFYFFNNGVTLTCSQFRRNALQAGNYRAKLEKLQVINGGQTCHTIWRTLEQLPGEDFSQTYILVRIYELDDDQRELVHEITYATNSQNPVDLRDLRANDEIQKRLELGLQDLGYAYTRKRGGAQGEGPVITPAQAAEAVLAVWKREPHLARSSPGQFFGRLYRRVFTESLTPVEVVLAVEILQSVREEERKILAIAKPNETISDVSRFLPYATHAVAMFVAEELFEGTTRERLLREYRTLLAAFRTSAPERYWRGVLQVRLLLALAGLDDQKASLQRLAGAFRRGDLLENTDRLIEQSERVRTSVAERLGKVTASLEEHRRLTDEFKRLFQLLETKDISDPSRSSLREDLDRLLDAARTEEKSMDSGFEGTHSLSVRVADTFDQLRALRPSTEDPNRS
jgi:AIPR protein